MVRLRISRYLIPFHIEIIVSVVVALHIAGVAAPGTAGPEKGAAVAAPAFGGFGGGDAFGRAGVSAPAFGSGGFGGGDEHELEAALRISWEEEQERRRRAAEDRKPDDSADADEPSKPELWVPTVRPNSWSSRTPAIARAPSE